MRMAFSCSSACRPGARARWAIQSFHAFDAEWIDTREVAWDANRDGRFVAIPSLEWTKQWGHINIYDPKTRRWPEDPAEFYKAAADELRKRQVV